MDPYAATPPAVFPGEHNPKSYNPTLPSIPGLDDTDVWHFQDDAVSGDVFIDEDVADGVPFVDQPTWIEEYYRFIWELCGTTGYVDGPPEIEAYSKDLAFELWTKDVCICKGDDDGDGDIDLNDLNVMVVLLGPAAPGYNIPATGHPCLDFDDDGDIDSRRRDWPGGGRGHPPDDRGDGR